jgi:hypothetical protein
MATLVSHELERGRDEIGKRGVLFNDDDPHFPPPFLYTITQIEIKQSLSISIPRKCRVSISAI